MYTGIHATTRTSEEIEVISNKTIVINGKKFDLGRSSEEDRELLLLQQLAKREGGHG